MNHDAINLKIGMVEIIHTYCIREMDELYVSSFVQPAKTHQFESVEQNRFAQQRTRN